MKYVIFLITSSTHFLFYDAILTQRGILLQKSNEMYKKIMWKIQMKYKYKGSYANISTET